MDHKFTIVEEKKDKDVLHVECFVELKQYAAHKDIKITSTEVQEALSQKYQFLEVLKEAEIWNTHRGNKKSRDFWLFRVSNKRKETKSTQKETPAPPKETVPEVEEPSPPAPKPAPKRKPAARKQNTGPKRSIRGRMSKIAQDKSGEK